MFTAVCVCVCVCVCVYSLGSDSLQPYRSSRLCPRNFPSKNTGVGCHFLLQQPFLTQRSNWPSLKSPALAGGFFTTAPPGEICKTLMKMWHQLRAMEHLRLCFLNITTEYTLELMYVCLHIAACPFLWIGCWTLSLWFKPAQNDMPYICGQKMINKSRKRSSQKSEEK